MSHIFGLDTPSGYSDFTYRDVDMFVCQSCCESFMIDEDHVIDGCEVFCKKCYEESS